MSFYKIEKTGCCERKGLLQVRYDLFWDEEDKEYQLVDVPIFPPEGYPGKVDEEGNAIDEKDYQAWKDSLPTQLINLPFITRLAYFEPDVTDEEIAYVGALKLELTAKYFPDLKQGNNIPFQWKPELKSLTEAKLAQIKAVDFTKVKNAELYKVK